LFHNKTFRLEKARHAKVNEKHQSQQ